MTLQDEDDPLSCWIHAVLYKIEGDAANSRYWYSRTAHTYGEFSDPGKELAAIEREINDRLKQSGPDNPPPSLQNRLKKLIDNF